MSIKSNVEYLASLRTSTNSNEPILFSNGNWIPEETLQKLREDFSSPTTEEEYRNRALLIVLTELGLLAKEIVSLRLSDISKDPSKQFSIEFIGKCGKRKSAPISEHCLKAVLEYHEKFEIDSDYFFVSRPGKSFKGRTNISTRALQYIVNSWNVRTISGKLIHPQSLRNTLGQRLLAGTPL
ncbi:site-specific integrase [Leptospira sp. id769339]|uniref:site-specific integrase n=1 Tax=Leptospira sp. id769339 TaxID=2864221 RepID=UPI00214C3B94|nr:site-specific integrase [Leptospira sp. id769339]